MNNKQITRTLDDAAELDTIIDFLNALIAKSSAAARVIIEDLQIDALHARAVLSDNFKTLIQEI